MKGSSGPSSSSLSPSPSHRKSPSREYYESNIHKRYYVNGNRISWEVEENPPVGSSSSSSRSGGKHHGGGSVGSRTGDGQNDAHGDLNRNRNGSPTPGSNKDGGSASGDAMDSNDAETGSDCQQKMKYRYVYNL